MSAFTLIIRRTVVIPLLLAANLAFSQNHKLRFERISIEQGLSQNGIACIFQDSKGFMWFGTNAGLNKYDGYNFTVYKHDPNEPNSLSRNVVGAIAEDDSGGLWIATWGGGLNRFDPKTGAFQHWLSTPKDTIGSEINIFYPQANNIVAIYEDDNGFLWIGTYGSKLLQFDRKTENFVYWPYGLDMLIDVGDKYILTFYENPFDSERVLWIGTHSTGLARLAWDDQGVGDIEHWQPEPGNPESINNFDVRCIHSDDSGRLWLGTAGGGLNIFDPKTETFRNYDVLDGLQGNEFNTGAALKSRSGEMFFGGINGFNSFYPDSIKDNPHIPPVVITDFQIFNKSVQISQRNETPRFRAGKHISATDEIVLSHRDNVFSFEFATLDYNAPQKNQYAYMMAGFDEDWIYSGTRRFATYTNLNPGEYVFRVKGSNNDGIWNEEGTSVRIICMKSTR